MSQAFLDISCRYKKDNMFPSEVYIDLEEVELILASGYYI